MLDPGLAARLTAVADEFRELGARLADPVTLADPDQLRTVSQRYRELEPVVACFDAYRDRLADLEAARELLELADGGDEADRFARDLLTMYEGYAARRKWKIETLSLDPSDLGGVNQATIVVRGDDAWQRLKFEGGPHRVQRVPVTESQGRVHTSSATVTVLPEADDVDVHIDDRDLVVDVYRSSGAGGQHVNTTDSAVRITHVPTGTVVAMQDERSQLQNRSRAMQVLRARLYELARRERDEELSAERRSQVGGGGRSEKIRTYNAKENRVTDHRIGLTVYRLADVMDGDLDLVIEPLLHDERAQQLAEMAG